jgi:hypothetical protein
MYENFIGKTAFIPYTDPKISFIIKEIRQVQNLTLAYSADGIVVNIEILLNEAGQLLTEEKENETQENDGSHKEGVEAQE